MEYVLTMDDGRMIANCENELKPLIFLTINLAERTLISETFTSAINNCKIIYSEPQKFCLSIS